MMQKVCTRTFSRHRLHLDRWRCYLPLIPREVVDLPIRWHSSNRTNDDDGNKSSSKGKPDSLSSSLRVAVVGSGPSGCFTAKYLRAALLKIPFTDTTTSTTSSSPFRLDVFERLPTPFGLVRFGVAPDHPEVKNVQNDFTELFQQHPTEVRFLGNVQVGKDISLEELRELYDIVVLAYGCESDRKLGIPGEDSLQGVLSAREFVAWYNGHPDYVHIGEQVRAAMSRSDRVQVVVLGQGNVALDCARILAKGQSGLHDTDVAAHSLSVIRNGAHRISVVGRRGHVQAAFTIKELRELTKLHGDGDNDVGFDTVHCTVFPEELDLGMTPASQQELSSPSGGRPKTRIDALLREIAQSTTLLSLTKPSSSSSDGDRQIILRFLLNPIRFEPDNNDPSKLGAVICERTILVGDAGHQRAVGTGQLETIPAHMALVSIGYKGTPLPGLEPWFDEQRGIVKNSHGKVDESGDGENNMLLGRLYVSGWLKRGPSGIIGTNIIDAKDTVATIVKDLEEGNIQKRAKDNDGDDVVHRLLKERGAQVIDWQAYERIDAAETRPIAKRSEKQPREKLTTRAELLAAAADNIQKTTTT